MVTFQNASVKKANVAGIFNLIYCFIFVVEISSLNIKKNKKLKGKNIRIGAEWD